MDMMGSMPGLAFTRAEQPNPRGPPPQPSHAQKQNVDKIATDLKLNDANRKFMHDVTSDANGPMHAIIALLGQVLAAQEREANTRLAIEKIGNRVHALEKNSRANWQLTLKQSGALKQVLRHWLAGPLNSYGRDLTLAFEDWLRHGGGPQVHLNNYKNDQVMQREVHAFITKYQSDHRGNLRKIIFRSVEERHSLSSFTRSIIAQHRTGTTEPQTVKAIEAHMALARKTAQIIIDRGLTKGADTGFWPDLSAEIKTLVATHGKDRYSPEWVA
ncbi:hypothetical protein BC834DRAFT_972516 [Gloeopeniophorella convolvens]|nr:hypothetical protein BC834DRAFT_972516 [Gloeopeniophorella convolvens]